MERFVVPQETVSERGDRGHFAPGNKAAVGHRRGPDKRSVEIEELSRAILEENGGVGKIAERLLKSGDERIQIDTLKLLLGYGWGLPRQRVSIGNDGATAIVLSWASAPGDDAAAPSGAAGDRGGPDEIPRRGDRETLGQKPNG